ncbi:MAG: hypothetical protein QOI24_2111 [Acidobacteriota bacterium]|nr:hypothetical protein [Acidobacteriota bacterium]
MKRLLIAMLVFAALPLAAADKPGDAYRRGVEAVRAKNYAAGAELLQRAIAENPTENGALRLRNEIITYVPHFWLGIAKLNLDDVDGALRELKTSEDQGVVQSTQYYASLRDWMSRAQSQKQKSSEAGAAESRNAATTAISAAMRAQNDAVAAGADRTDGYRAAQRKLQEAKEQAKEAGTDSRLFRRAADTASQAASMFASTAEDARKQRANRTVQVAKQTTPAIQPQPVPPPQPQPQPVSVPVMPPTVTATVADKKAVVAAPAPAPVQIESEALVDARLAVQQYRRHLVDSGVASNAQLKEVTSIEKQLAANASDATIRKITDRIAANEKTLSARMPQVKTATVTIVDPTLELAYRAYAAGDLARADELLSRLLESKRSPEALLLRGCTRYTRSVLSRQPNLAAAANADLKAALSLNTSLRLDPKSFSPKLVAWFDQVRRQ